MKCIICHGQEIQETAVKEELKINNNIVYVPIEIPVCQTCGERYYDRRTMQYLEDAAVKLKRNQLKLQEVGKVLEYSGSPLD